MVTDEKIKARAVWKLRTKGYFLPRAAKVGVVAQWAAPSHDQGRAKDLIHAMAKNDACPLVYKPKSGREAVGLEPNSEGWAKSWVERFYPEMVEQYEDLRILGD